MEEPSKAVYDYADGVGKSSKIDRSVAFAWSDPSHPNGVHRACESDLPSEYSTIGKEDMVVATVGGTPAVACGMVSFLLSLGASTPVIERVDTWSEAPLPKANASDGIGNNRSHLGGGRHHAQAADSGSVIWHLRMLKNRREITRKRGDLSRNMTIPLWRVCGTERFRSADRRFFGRVWYYPAFPNAAPAETFRFDAHDV